jgi:hypothetical protein
VCPQFSLISSGSKGIAIGSCPIQMLLRYILQIMLFKATEPSTEMLEEGRHAEKETVESRRNEI